MISSNTLDIPTHMDLIGRQVELRRVAQTLANDKDLLIGGVPGSGRRTLVRQAAHEIGAFVIDIDCIRAVNSKSFVKILCESFAQQVLRHEEAQSMIHDWIAKSAVEMFELKENNDGRKCFELAQPLNKLSQGALWKIFEELLHLPQLLAERMEQRVVLVLYSFPHIRCWDRDHKWELELRQKIKIQTQVSYVIVTTIPEIDEIEKNNATENTDNLEIVELEPLSEEIVAIWIQEVLRTKGLTFNPLEEGLEFFLSTVQGHFGDARALARRLLALQKNNEQIQIGEAKVQQAIKELLQDFSAVFESLLVQLPENQAQLLECLALYPTDKPHSREYIQEHSLSRGGTLQNALVALQQKGLIYGSKRGYRLTLPLMAKWVRRQLG